MRIEKVLLGGLKEMNGAPKYREILPVKYRKEIILILCSLFIFFTIGNVFVPTENIQTKANNIPNAYNVVYNGKSLGIVDNQSTANRAFQLAKAKVVDADGNRLKVTTDLKFYLEYADPSEITENDILVMNMQDALNADKASFLVSGYVLEIGDEFKVVLEDQEAVKEVLKRAQQLYVNAEEGYRVDLVRVPYTSAVSMPVIVKDDTAVGSISTPERTFQTSTNTATKAVNAASEAVADEEADNGEIPVETVGVSFAQKIQVVKQYVQQDDIKSIAVATEMITKENEKEKTYAVEQGDTLSGIASKNDMKLQDLLKMNPGVESQKYINIGQQIIVTVPEPELSVATKEKIAYTKPIPRSVTKVENKDKYKGTNTILDNGADGEMLVTAIVTKVNGYEESREVVDEKVVTEPKDKVLEVGIKPFPSKGATGNFVYPVVGGTFSSPFGYRRGGFHHGIDLAISTGTPIRASDGGRVIFAGWKNSTYGYAVDIDHGNGVLTRYAHCSRILVKSGQSVSQYQTIAKVGSTGKSTGPHVHFEIRFNGVAANPMKYIN
ncbi:peptidoglycan DD-metalloendopeptidase family protein [Vallitalea pronyensis]|uniref:Peptidoglycan DD-metalloendopeptidase family protein n=1 Tax=Vallitalea pronyensis TaxID=1348613 RepID=A0A8J8MGY0_9FIRM|nr:M23 family metallopeptidase [Vallitalea pronyensis]QUI21292.1 peptidoglycan DD-metalloendopeptidase family protein [Vallitalea pronyensis]